MAKAATATKKATGTAVAKWDEELARQAEAAAKMEANAGGGQFFSLKNGQLSFNDSPLPDNQAAVIIVDHVLENVFYAEDYDPDAPQAPTCYAFGRDEATLTPHQQVIDADQAVADQCHSCPNNEWGTAERGRGKACRNVRRLALIPAGSFNDKTGKFEPEDDEELLSTTPLAYLKLPLTSVKGFASFVKQVAGTLKRPPHAIYTRLKVVPDASTQFKVLFEPLGMVPNELLGAVMKRHEEAEQVIDFPYPELEESSTPKRGAAKGRGKPAAKKPANNKKAGRRY